MKYIFIQLIWRPQKSRSRERIAISEASDWSGQLAFAFARLSSVHLSFVQLLLSSLLPCPFPSSAKPPSATSLSGPSTRVSSPSLKRATCSDSPSTWLNSRARSALLTGRPALAAAPKRTFLPLPLSTRSRG
jgi:hypothetical protein